MLMKRKSIITVVIVFIFTIMGILSYPTTSHAATTENLFPFRDAADPNSKVTTDVTFNEDDSTISNTYPNNNVKYHYSGRLQKITLTKKADVTLYIYAKSTISNGQGYNQDSILFGIFSEPNADHANKILSCTGSTVPNSLRYGTCTATLEAGTYYLAIYSMKTEGKTGMTNTATVYANYKYYGENVPPVPPTPSKTSIGVVSISKISNRVYTGKAISPSIKLTYKGKQLVKGTDFNLRFKNNANPGKAYGTITGIGKYAGTKTVTFKIIPKKASMSKVKSTKKKTLKAYWKKDSKASGYQVIVAQNSKFTKGKKSAYITKNKTTSKTFTKLKSKKKYYVKARAYKTIDGKKAFGAYSKYKTVKVK